MIIFLFCFTSRPAAGTAVDRALQHQTRLVFVDIKQNGRRVPPMYPSLLATYIFRFLFKRLFVVLIFVPLATRPAETQLLF
jgi:hypothetical protein